MNLNEKSHRIKILSTIFIIFIIYFQFVHPHFNNEKKSGISTLNSKKAILRMEGIKEMVFYGQIESLQRL